MESARLNRLIRFAHDGLERIIKPYALVFKRRKDGVGREYFYGWDRLGGRSGEVGIKSYIADKVQGVTIMEETFEPRFRIELTKLRGYFGSLSFSASRQAGLATGYQGRTEKAGHP